MWELLFLVISSVRPRLLRFYWCLISICLIINHNVFYSLFALSNVRRKLVPQNESFWPVAHTLNSAAKFAKLLIALFSNGVSTAV